MAPFVFVILHNLFYGLTTLLAGLQILFVPLQVISFVIAVVVAPVLFVVGLVGSLVLVKESNRQSCVSSSTS